MNDSTGWARGGRVPGERKRATTRERAKERERERKIVRERARERERERASERAREKAREKEKTSEEGQTVEEGGGAHINLEERVGAEHRAYERSEHGPARNQPPLSVKQPLMRTVESKGIAWINGMGKRGACPRREIEKERARERQ